MCEVNDREFLTFNDDAAVLGISTDGLYSACPKNVILARKYG